jgi:hypothetical protein
VSEIWNNISGVSYKLLNLKCVVSGKKTMLLLTQSQYLDFIITGNWKFKLTDVYDSKISWPLQMNYIHTAWTGIREAYDVFICFTWPADWSFMLRLSL